MATELPLPVRMRPIRFLFASNPGIMGKLLGIVYRVLSGALLKKAGYTRKDGITGAVTLIQRFGRSRRKRMMATTRQQRTDASDRPDSVCMPV